MIRQKLLSFGKSFFYIVLLVCANFFADAQDVSTNENIRQVLVPKEVYLGDKAQIQYSFVSQIDFFSKADSNAIKNNTLFFDHNIKEFASLADKCTVTDFRLLRNGNSYTIVISFIPWMPGSIDIDPFDLNSICRSTLAKSDSADANEVAPFIIDIKSIEIASISDKMGVSTIRPELSPLLLPGTHYFIWLFVLISFFVILCVVFIIVKAAVLIANWKILGERLYQYRNIVKTKRDLKKLLKKDCSDEAFALEWETISRSFLSRRYDFNFDSCPSSRIRATIERLTSGLLDINQTVQIEDINAMFIRCDYIKFASGSIDSKQLPFENHAAAFTLEERKSFVENMIQAIDIITAEPVEENDDI